MFFINVVFKGFINAGYLPSVFPNFFVCTNEIEILCDPRCMERLQCADFQVHRNILWNNEPYDLAHHACAFYRRKNLHDLLTVNSRCLTKLILLSSFHDFFQRNNSPCQSTTLLKATLLLNENQLLLFSFKRKVKELPLLI